MKERILKINMNITANKLYFIYGRNILKSIQKAKKKKISLFKIAFSFYLEYTYEHRKFEIKGNIDQPDCEL